MHDATERECLDIFWAVLLQSQFLTGTGFVSQIEHDSVKWILNLSNVSRRLARWRIRSSMHELDVGHHTGVKQKDSNEMSRLRFDVEKKIVSDDELSVCSIKNAQKTNEKYCTCMVARNSTLGTSWLKANPTKTLLKRKRQVFIRYSRPNSKRRKTKYQLQKSLPSTRWEKRILVKLQRKWEWVHQNYTFTEKASTLNSADFWQHAKSYDEKNQKAHFPCRTPFIIWQKNRWATHVR